MIEIEKPQIECVETPGDASYGKYVIEPLERGYGTTLGNALRRILLSSLPGTAATSIKIAGVQHEFSTIPGVKEDVTEIVLNVKNLLTKLAAVLVSGGLKQMKKLLSSSEVGGTALVGISKPVIKAHGSSDAYAIKNAVRQAKQYVSSGIIESITENVDVMRLDPPLKAKEAAKETAPEQA